MTDPKPISVDGLAQEIRRVDGNHSLGAGELAEALMPYILAAERRWVPVSERVPEGSKPVLVWATAGGKPRALRAWYTRPFTEQEYGGETDESALDERNGTYYFKEGWYEGADGDDEMQYMVEGVTHWMPLPAQPEV